MTRIKYDQTVMKYITLFESISRAHVKDCIPGEDLTFIINKGDMSKAIGKKGANINKIERILKKKIVLIEFEEQPAAFIKNLIFPTKAEISENDNIITIKAPNVKTKGRIFGRDRSNLARIKEIVKRFFPIQDIKVE